MILVTGASGFLGGKLIEMLRERNPSAPLRALVRSPQARLRELGVEEVLGTLEGREGLQEAARGVTTVFHCAAKAGVWGDWSAYFAANVEGTHNLLEVCRAQGVSRFVFTSSPSVTFSEPGCSGSGESDLGYPENFLNPYSETKALAEKAVLDANGRGGMATVALRPHLIWGPGDPHLVPRLVQAARQGKLRQIGKGDNQVDLTHVENAAWGHLLAAEHLSLESPLAGQAYFLSDGEPVYLWRWIESLLSDLELPPLQKPIPLNAARRLGSILEWGYRTLRLPGDPPMTRFLALQLALPHYYSIEAAARDFGYAPRVHPEQARPAWLEWLRRRQ